jgi:DNA-binding MarR family transcriptional regulator
MERDDWIERGNAPNDRRKKIIRPTERVADRLGTIIQRGEAMEQRAITGLSEKQIQELDKILTIIRQNLGSEI